MRTGSKSTDAAGFMVMRLLGRILLVGRAAIGYLTVADRLTNIRRERHLGCQGRREDELEREHVSDSYAHETPKRKSGFAAKHRVPLGTATTFRPQGTSSELLAKRRKIRTVTTRQQSGYAHNAEIKKEGRLRRHRQTLASLSSGG